MAGRVVVTGATGFVGSHLCAVLRAAGYEVAALGRAETGELGPGTDWSPWLDDGVDCVFHLAGRAHVMRDTAASPAAAYDAVNRGATDALARQAAAAGVRRIVYMSSVKALTEAGADVPADAPARPEDDYGRSKLAAELALRAVPRLEHVILRPPLVYGPGVKGNFIRLIRLVDRGVPLPLASVRNRRSMISLTNLCDAVIHAAHCAPGLYCPTDAVALSTPDLIRTIAAAFGKKAALFPFPPALLAAAGALTGKGGLVRRLTGTLTVTGAPPGWQPPETPDRGIRRTVEWYRTAESRDS